MAAVDWQQPAVLLACVWDNLVVDVCDGRRSSIRAEERPGLSAVVASLPAVDGEHVAEGGSEDAAGLQADDVVALRSCCTRRHPTAL